MTLPEAYGRKSERIIPTYDYFDIAEGTGIVKLYLSTSEINTGLNYHLGRDTTYSSLIDSQSAITSGMAKEIDLDFDLSPFNMPKSIKGVANAQATLKVYSATGTSACSAYIIFKVRKWDGSSETEIASAQSQTVVPPNGSSIWEIVNVPITITKTNFKKGETLRLTVEVWGASGADGGVIFVGHDPQNRDSIDVAAPEGIRPSVDSPTSITKSHIFVPFIINL